MSATAIATKVKWSLRSQRRDALPPALICKTTEAEDLLGKQTFQDALAAGWLKPCCEKPNRKDSPTKFYSVAAVQDVARRMLDGEYPTPSKG